ncbi:hypothetical protein P692DRAFT_201607075 [Suillus brevipes Sb2]|nr:hypothetical protein P692DRAFT_201607075 [Suillus brevipes Sb2]
MSRSCLISACPCSAHTRQHRTRISFFFTSKGEPLISDMLQNDPMQQRCTLRSRAVMKEERIIATSPFHGAFKFHWLRCLRFLSRRLPPLAT